MLSTLENLSPPDDPDFLTSTLSESKSINELSRMNLWSELPFITNFLVKSVPWYTVNPENVPVLGELLLPTPPASKGLLTVTSSGIEKV